MITLTTNRLFCEWGRAFADEVLATALLGCPLHHCEAVSNNGTSYRFEDRHQAVERDTGVV